MLDPSRYGGYALVTGASSGIGAEFARQLAASGMPCIIVARRADRLERLRRELSAEFGVDVRSVVQDLSAEDASDRLCEAIADLDVGLLVNNAGFGDAGRFVARDPKRMVEMIKLNCVAPVLLTRRLLPTMVERGRGAVVVVSSALGVVACPNECVYGATKAFDLSFGEALWAEMRGTGVDVVTVCPGGTATEFSRVEGFSEEEIEVLDRYSASPTDVVRTALRGLRRNRPVVMCRDSAILESLHRVLPRAWSLRVLEKVTPHLRR